MQNILAIGFDTRNIVCSASRAGYTVCSIDAFRDLDLQECVYASALLNAGLQVNSASLTLDG